MDILVVAGEEVEKELKIAGSSRVTAFYRWKNGTMQTNPNRLIWDESMELKKLPLL
jgi:uncharacterized protein (DUF2237 family)